MIKLKTLLTENFSKKDFAKMYFSAYSTIFDVDMDDIKYFRADYLMPPSYVHVYYALTLKLTYKAKKYCIYNKFYYYKFPKDELVGLNREDWMEMLHQSEKMETHNIDSASIRKPNKLFIFNVSVVEGEDFLHGDDLGTGKECHSMLDAIQEAKRIIDKSDSSNDGNSEETPIVPNPKNSKLVTV